MKNIEYLESFFRKHNLSGRITVKYMDENATDDYMSNIVFEDGEVINIHDIIFDIDSELENDVFEQWLKDRKKNNLTLAEWMRSNNHYKPKNIDRSSIEEYQKEVEDIMETVKKSMNKVFELDIEDEKSS